MTRRINNTLRKPTTTPTKIALLFRIGISNFFGRERKSSTYEKILRIGFIGALHMMVYLWLLPFVILPKFGNIGTKITVTILILISLIVLSSLIIKKRK